MLIDITRVRYIRELVLEIFFEDGVHGEVDLSEILVFTGIFEPLKEESFAKKVFVNPDTGTIEWPNGADIDPVTLYSKITGKPIIFSTESPLPKVS